MKNSPYSALVIEDDENLAAALQDFLEEEGWEIDVVSTARDAHVRLVRKIYDLIIADYLLPDANALSLLEELRVRSPLTKVLIITGVKDLSIAAQAFKEGAGDFLFKPFTLHQLQKRIEALMEERRLETEREKQRFEPEDAPPPVEIVGRSPAIDKVFQLINLVAEKNTTVLITGESGTGKELVARAIHIRSGRRAFPFVAINCAAIPESLLEDELFGHVRGAYTDAREDRKGKFEEADGGTLFLDEIGDMPVSLQVKLLRVIDEKKFQKLGSNRTIEVDPRIVVATNSDLQSKVHKGEFRSDLYYRLKVVPIHLPPLRERKEDLPLLATHFLEEFSREYELPNKKLSPGALKQLMARQWPGNVRELRNVLELASVLSGNERIHLESDDFSLMDQDVFGPPPFGALSDQIQLPDRGLDLNDFLRGMERRFIQQSLERTGGNKQQAARLLGLKRTTLLAKLQRLEDASQ